MSNVRFVRPGDTRGTLGDTSGECPPEQHPVGGSGDTRSRGRGHPDFCPFCGWAAEYDDEMDRFVHQDVFRDYPCWRAILRGNHTYRGAQHALYRFWSGSHELLYIGITLDPGTRWADHRRTKVWWQEVAAITIQPYSSRESVIAAEKNAIETERPLYNILMNRGESAPPPAPARRGEA